MRLFILLLFAVTVCGMHSSHTSGITGLGGTLSTVETSGITTYNEEDSDGSCDSTIQNTPLAVDTGATDYSVSDSLFCDSGKVILVHDDNGHVDSVILTSPARCTLLITGLNPSTTDSVRLVFASDTSSTVDTSDYIIFLTKDTSDTVPVEFPPVTQYVLTVDTGGNGTVAPAVGDTLVDSAGNVPVTATETIGWEFAYWETVSGTVAWDDSAGASANCTLSVGAAEIRAVFTRITYTVTVIDSPTAGGSSVVFTSPVDSAEACTTVYVPAVGYQLTGWGTSDDDTASSGDTLFHNEVGTNITDTAFSEIKTYAIDTTIANGLPDNVVFDECCTVDSNTTVTVTVGVPDDSICTVSGDFDTVITAPGGSFERTISANTSLTFTFNEPNLPVTVTLDPVNTTDSLGDDTLLWITKTGTVPITGQWQYALDSSGTYSNITDSTADTLRLLSLALSDSGWYRWIGTNAYGSDTSAAAHVVVLHLPLLTINVTGTGTVDTLPSGQDGLFEVDAACTLVTTPAEGYTVYFSGDTTSTNGDTAFITMDGDKTVGITFQSLSTNDDKTVFNKPKTLSSFIYKLRRKWHSMGAFK